MNDTIDIYEGINVEESRRFCAVLMLSGTTFTIFRGPTALKVQQMAEAAVVTLTAQREAAPAPRRIAKAQKI